MTFIKLVLVIFVGVALVIFVETPSVAFIISSYTITEVSAILSKYLPFSQCAGIPTTIFFLS